MRRDRASRALVTLALTAFLVAAGACGPDAVDIGADDRTLPPEPTAPEETDPPMDANDLPAGHHEQARLAIADLADRIGADPEAITVVRAEDVTWRDGSIGCPEPDGMYTQALVDGYRIELRAEGATYHYHGANGEPPFHCPDDRREEPSAGDG